MKEVTNLFGYLAEPSKGQELENALCKIYLEAVHLAASLRRQRARWTVEFPLKPVKEGGSRLMFDPNCMRDESNTDDALDVETLRQQLVEIVVTPALLKRGNADGEHLDKVHTAVPASVAIYGR